MADSIARQFARWAANLKYEDLPPEVVDKVRSLIMVHMVSAVFGAQMKNAQDTIHMVKQEEGKPDGATILFDGSKATRIGATYANSEMIHLPGLWDQFRMITHPGVSLIPAGIVNAELEKATGKQLITALVAGYELSTRMAEDTVPSTAARGFRPAPIYHTMGAAVIAAKLMNLNEEGMMSAIAIAANCTSGLFESGRSGGGETGVHDPNAARQGVFSAMVAREGHIKASEQVIEGPAGFLNAFIGSHTGKLTYAFEGPLQADLGKITEGLGTRFQLMDLMYRMYDNAGYNHAPINMMVEMREQYGINPDDVEEVIVTMNFIETLYPSPQFPRDPANPPRVGATHWYVAHALVNGGFPQVGGPTFGPTGDDLKADKKVEEFTLNRVTITAAHDFPMFSPKAVIRMKDGRNFTGEYPYARLCWDYDGLVERLRASGPKYPLGGQAGLDSFIDLCRTVDQMDSIQPLLDATTKK